MFLLGPLLVLIFTLSQSVRDVYFGSVFRRLDFFLVILLAFSWSTVIFAGLKRAPKRATVLPCRYFDCRGRVVLVKDDVLSIRLPGHHVRRHRQSAQFTLTRDNNGLAGAYNIPAGIT